MKKLGFIVAFIAALVFAGCASTGGSKASEPEEDIGNEWTLDLNRIETTSWSDGNPNSKNPPAETAEAAENPNGGWDYTFTMYNQRIIYVLSRAQAQKIRKSSSIEVIIDGESNGSHKFRYHVGDSEVGSDWNATESFDEAPFSSIVNRTIKVDRSRVMVMRNFMIQTRGENTSVAFTPPETVTIRSIKFICK
jgi:hypothetical protein